MPKELEIMKNRAARALANYQKYSSKLKGARLVFPWGVCYDKDGHREKMQIYVHTRLEDMQGGFCMENNKALEG